MHFFNRRIQDRRNCYLTWCPSDNPEAYKEEGQFGPNPYTPKSFGYQFNSHGFRCDEFDLPSPIPILFLGCSFTEGTGVPKEAVWAYQILEKIKAKTGKDIPYWNLAVGAAGIDTQASFLTDLGDIIKPRHIIFMRPPWTRRQIVKPSNEIIDWMPGHQGFDKFEPFLINEENALFQADRSLCILNLLAEKYNAYIHYTSWSHRVEDSEIEPYIQKYRRFRKINFKFPNKVDNGRDDQHPGPLTHKMCAEQMWEQDLKHYF
jgi:hypothetical protein